MTWLIWRWSWRNKTCTDGHEWSRCSCIKATGTCSKITDLTKDDVTQWVPACFSPDVNVFSVLQCGLASTNLWESHSDQSMKHGQLINSGMRLLWDLRLVTSWLEIISLGNITLPDYKVQWCLHKLSTVHDHFVQDWFITFNTPMTFHSLLLLTVGYFSLTVSKWHYTFRPSYNATQLKLKHVQLGALQKNKKGICACHYRINKRLHKVRLLTKHTLWSWLHIDKMNTTIPTSIFLHLAWSAAEVLEMSFSPATSPSLSWGNPEAFPGQIWYKICPECSGSALGSSLSWTCPK